VSAALGDRFGPRGDRFHSGIDLLAAAGTPVRAAGPGTVSFAGWSPGGYGKLLVIDHANGVSTWYAHLSSIDVTSGTAVTTAAQVGLVGATGNATGPHLHFEVRLRGAITDPLAALR
jgi:murein DD-endopeptidase MepM/ murein hydrolase activator NlpD